MYLLFCGMSRRMTGRTPAALGSAILFLLGLVVACSRDTGATKEFIWRAPDTARIPATDEGRLISYGRDLIANTAHYLGEHGSVAAISNGMNCGNCHLAAGTKAWGNNYSAVFSTYPRFRDRSGSVETIGKRVNDCLERSLNGRPLDSNSREMKAIVAYFRWLGQGVPAGVRPASAGIRDLRFLDRAADPEKGRVVYQQYCQRCHGTQGEGMPDSAGVGYLYPPLWGEHSFTTAAGLFRLSRLAGYVKDNMPNGTTYEKPVLSDEQSWDVAAFINSRQRPVRVFAADWPKIAKKPVDYPYGPYADSFSEERHKYGPFGAMRRGR